MSTLQRLDAKEILSKIDIVDVISRYINVTKEGKNYKAVCPFHNDTNPSLMISKEKQIFKCFVCGTSGNAISFIQKYEKISYVDALYKAAEIAGVQVQKTENVADRINQPYLKCMDDLMQYYSFALLSTSSKDAMDYCISRGLSDDIRKRFNIGYAPINGEETIKYLQGCGNSLKIIRDLELVNSDSTTFYDKNAGRVIFGITNQNNRIIAFSARKFGQNAQEDSPKYINSSESKIFFKSFVLYNSYYGKESAKHDGYLYVVEGFMDVISLYKAGISSVVGLMGTALSSEHINFFKYLNVEIRLCLDGDDPGQKAMVEIIKKFDKAQISYRIVKRSALAKDTDEILNKFGKDKLLEYIGCLESKQEFLIEYFSKSYDLTDDDERKRFVKSIIPFAINAANPLDLEEYEEKIAKISKFSKASIVSEVNRYKKNLASKAIGTSSDEVLTTDIGIQQRIKESANATKRIAKLENELMYQMLASPNAIKYFTNNIQYFYNSIYSNLAIYLQDYYEENHDLSIPGIIDYINSVPNDNDVDSLVDAVVYLSTDTSVRHSPTTPKVLEAIGKSLQEERKFFTDIKNIDNQIELEIDEGKRVELLDQKAKIFVNKEKNKL